MFTLRIGEVMTSRKPLWQDLQPVDIKDRWRHNWKSAQVVISHLVCDPTIWQLQPPSATVVSAEPFLHRTGTLRCLQKEMATYRHWSVSLWWDPDDVSHGRILSPDKYWMVAYLGYTLQMKMLFCGWPVMVHDTHMRRRRMFTNYCWYRDLIKFSIDLTKSILICLEPALWLPDGYQNMNIEFLGRHYQHGTKWAAKQLWAGVKAERLHFEHLLQLWTANNSNRNTVRCLFERFNFSVHWAAWSVE